jgi:Ser/Thr protein kinase RdoA (MazF antagonist)
MEYEAGLRAHLETWLTRLRRPLARLRDYQVLGRGISGAATYLLSLDGEWDVVLKITAATAARYVRERAHRELAFYRNLACRIPLRVPHLVAVYAGPAGYALLLDACGHSLPPELWSETLYLEAARQLARFHAAFWNRTTPLATFRWLRRPSEDAAAEIRQAQGYWRALYETPRFAEALTADTYQWLRGLLSRMPEVAALIDPLPLTLCHGDCHQGNVLRDACGRLVWLDWQEVRLGHGPDDLSFFLQRAAVDGGTVPYDAVLALYHDCLAMETGAAIPLAMVRRAVSAAELRSRALQWPAYLGQAPAGLLAAMVERIRRLARELDLD